MNRSLPTACRVTIALMASFWLPMTVAKAQLPGNTAQGYQAPNFAGMSGQTFHQAQQIPAFPASPLAGGPAAAQGSDFVDVQGKSIVMQTQYGEFCPPAFAGGGGGFTDPMAVDFGGFGEEQVGPHYFDFSADVVFMQARELFASLGPLSSAGAGPNAPRLLTPNDSSEDFEAGFQISARYDIGALSVLEATYMGIFDFGFSESVNSVALLGVPNSLFTPFSNFGVNGANIVPGFDFGNTHTVSYESDLQSTELSYRRYWVGANPRVSGTWLAGARYVRMTEDFNYSSIGGLNSGAGPQAAANLRLGGSNDLVGFQFGGDGWLGLRQGLRIGGEGKAGVYNNRYEFRSAATLPQNADFDVQFDGNQVAFVAEGGTSIVADILPSLSIRGGYKVLYLNSIATAGATFSSTLNSNVIGAQGHALYHGFHGGIEYVW